MNVVLIGSGYVGIVFGAQDAEHYYFSHLPRWGQLYRARAFYAAIGKADGSGYIRQRERSRPCG